MNGLPPPDWQGSASDYLGQSAPQPVPPPPQDPTLGQVTQTAGGGGDIMQQYQQALQLAQRAYAPALRQPIQEPQHGLGWWLGNIATFGAVGMGERDYRNAYNREIMKNNQAVQMRAADDALGIVKAKMGLGSQMANLNMRLAGLDMQGQRLQMAQQAHQLRLLEFQIKNGRPPSPGELEAGEAMGEEPTTVQVPGMGPIRTWKPKGEIPYNPPAPGSPAAGLLGTPEANQPNQSNLSSADKYRARQLEFEQKKTDIKTNAANSVAEAKMQREQQRTVGPALAMAKELQAAVEQAYSSSQGPFASQTIGRVQRTWGALVGDPKYVRLKTFASKLPEIITGLGQEKRISDADMKFALQGIPGSGDTLPAARVKIGDLVKRLENRLAKPPSQEELGTKPTAPTTPTSLDDLLKKHGY